MNQHLFFGVLFLSFVALQVSAQSSSCVLSPLVKPNPPPQVPCLVNCTRGVCGNGLCEAVPAEQRKETCENCPQDCGACPVCAGICGNQRCEPLTGESSCNCPQDCGSCCIDGKCSAGENFDNCASDCSANLAGEVYETQNYTLVPASVTCSTVLTVALDQNLGGDFFSTGTFVFYGLPFDHYTCCATAPNYYPNCQTITLLNDGVSVFNKTVRIPLTLKSSSISGTIREFSSRSYLRYANVSCASASAGTIAAFTDYNGLYHLLNVRPGVYQCEAKLPGYTRSVATVNVNFGDNLSVNFALQPLNGTLTVNVIDKYSKSGIASTVRCYPYANKTALPILSAPSGSGTFNDVPPGQYSCRASAFKYISADTCVTIPPGGRNFSTIVITPATGGIKGTVRDVAGGSPLVGALVKCQLGPYSFTDITGVNGVFRWIYLEPGAYSCTISREGYTTVSASAVVAIGSSTNLDTNLSKL